MSDVRAVLLKPGDALLIGNIGVLEPEEIDSFHAAVQVLKERLGLVAVVLFEADIDVGAVAASDLTTGLSTRGGHSG